MLPSSGLHRIAFPLCLSAALTALSGAAVGQQTEDFTPTDNFILCNVFDHEIFEQVIAWQAPSNQDQIQTSIQQLFIGHLNPMPTPLQPPSPPYTKDNVFRVTAEYMTPYDTGLPPLGQSFNGPELGLDQTNGNDKIEITYTKATTGDNWYVARMANAGLHQPPGAWLYKEWLNNGSENRWGPFTTQSEDVSAQVVYFHTPGARTTQDRRMAFRPLENNGTEHIIDDANATFYGNWAHIDGKDYIVAAYGPINPPDDTDIVLYDVSDPTNVVKTTITDTPGRRNGAHIEFDPYSQQYMLVSVRTDYTVPQSPTTWIEIYQRDAGTHAWSFLYEFNAADAGDLLNPNVQSPELFTYGDRLFIVYVTSDTGDFVTAQRGNIRITRIETDKPPLYFKRTLNVEDDQVLGPFHKRTEPEIHYLGNNIPVVFYAQQALTAAQGDTDGCHEGVNKLMRAKTGTLPQT